MKKLRILYLLKYYNFGLCHFSIEAILKLQKLDFFKKSENLKQNF
jgi:hypothetical protein